MTTTLPGTTAEPAPPGGARAATRAAGSGGDARAAAGGGRRRRLPALGPPSTGPASSRWPDPLVDAAAAVLLAVLAVAGLHHLFTDAGYLVIALAGAVLAAAVVLAVQAPRHGRPIDPFAATVALVLAYPLGAGVAMRTGLVPGVDAVLDLAGALVRSWKDVLTTAPPISLARGVGAIPYTMAYTAAGAGLLLARHRSTLLGRPSERRRGETRLRRYPPVRPALPALLALVAAFLLGTAEPVSVLAQGAGMAVLVLAWGAVRANRPRRTDGAPHWPRLVSGSVMLVAVAVAGLVIGPRLPVVGGEPTDRFHAREVLVPPLDPRDEPSPLAGYRNYVVEAGRDRTLLSVSGMPADARIRLATMDTYDGNAWVVGGPSGRVPGAEPDDPGTGRFDRVGEQILPVPPGRPATVGVRIEQDRPDMWVPTVDATRAVRFDGPRSRDLAEAFRYNRTTRTAVAPIRLRAGESFTLEAQVAPAVDEAKAKASAPVGGDRLPPVPPLPEPITRRATALTLDAATAYDKARALADSLRDGTPQLRTWYSDGGSGTEGTGAASASGHSLARLTRFVEAPGGFVGNAEQYAALMALMARWLGLPAQVVLGFPPPAQAGDIRSPVPVRAGAAEAWVEIAFEGVGWIPFDPTPPRERKPDVTPQVTERPVELSQQEPPPPTFLQVPESLPELVVRPPEPPRSSDTVLDVAAGILRTLFLVTSPLWLAAAVAAAIVAAKASRAQRRRRHGSAAARLAGAWWEVCDRARDLGAPVPLRATRQEVARSVSAHFPGAPPLAARIDEAMFAAPVPAEEVVAAIWDKLDDEHRKVVRRLRLPDRLRAAVNPASLRPRRWQRPPAR
jgi:transglutaminase-like putative cysteine protease